jgi:tRNA threonylcarbamoyl adenosine modification protein YeaZ
MLVLALDTATPALTVGLVRVDAGVETLEIVAAHVQVDARRHGELLTPAITTMLDEAGVKPADLGAIVAGLGPGPFTGLRVGLATAAALADAIGIPVYGVCSLDGIRTPAEPTLVATDARRREIYWATYVAGQRVHGPAVDRPQEVVQRLPELGVSAMVGAGAEMYADVLGLPLQDSRYPTVARLVERAADRIRAGAAADPLTPLYLRRPDVTMPTARKPVTPV